MGVVIVGARASTGSTTHAGRQSREDETPTRVRSQHPTEDAPGPGDDRLLLIALRAGDERAFAVLLERHSSAMLRFAMLFVRSRADAEEAVQETWISVLRNLEHFEGRSSLRTWIFVILANCARKHAMREGRSIPFSALSQVSADDDDDHDVDADRFFPADHPRWANAWATVVPRWESQPEEQALSREAIATILAAIEELPPSQRAVILLRDVEDWSSSDVCDLLALTPGNQRILLHRARSKIRAALERLETERAVA